MASVLRRQSARSSGQSGIASSAGLLICSGVSAMASTIAIARGKRIESVPPYLASISGLFRKSFCLFLRLNRRNISDFLKMPLKSTNTFPIV